MVSGHQQARRSDTIRWFDEVGQDDVREVGGKNASLGEMIRHLGARGVRVPAGFAVTANAYARFVEANDLAAVVREQIDALHDGADLADIGAAIRTAMLEGDVPPDDAQAISAAYDRLGKQLGKDAPPVAVRSSATAEDLPEASFAGQQESFLDVSGANALLDACRRCYASLFTDRAISYREERGFDHLAVELSIGVQQMVPASEAGSGVMFTLDSDSGFDRVVTIDAAWGLGESVVGGTVDPDHYVVFTPLLDDEGVCPIISKRRGAKERKVVRTTSRSASSRTKSVSTDDEERAGYVLDDDEILQLARWGAVIQRHYGRPMDIEWAKHAEDGTLHVVQARPETVHSQADPAALRTYRLRERGEILVRGHAIGDAIATGPVCRLADPDSIDDFVEGSVLVTSATDPDWEPIMRRAAAIVTEQGGRTSHAAIVSRELGVVAVVGADGATGAVDDGRDVTVSCAEGDTGIVYDGVLEFDEEEVDLSSVPDTETAIMLNLADPSAAFRWWRLPADGVGLARIEFIITNQIGVHPLALTRYEELDRDDRTAVDELAAGYEDRTAFFVEGLSHGIARLAAAWHPRPVLVRLSDFKTNEYAGLVGGRAFEPEEENPMLGWRGASRYATEGYADGFALECAAIRRVRDEIGLTNVIVMVPFCRTLGEADGVLTALADNGLERGRNGLAVYVMAEIPSNILLADQFATRFDGFSIGSNDLTQLVLGVDRDSELLAPVFDERDPAVVACIEQLIEQAHRQRRPVGLCGQRPSDDASFATLLVEAGIDSISVSPDSFLDVKRHVAEAERRRHVRTARS